MTEAQIQYIPNRCQRPRSSQFESQRRARIPETKLSAIPSRLGKKRLAILVPLSEDAWCDFSNLRTSRTITGGVRTTARAKLNSSAFLFAIPKRSPVDMVAPERENPRKGKQIPCTAPIQQELLRSVEPFSPGLLRLVHPAKMINTPTAASAAEIKGIFPKR